MVANNPQYTMPLLDKLKDKGINLSHQRLKVLEYMLTHEGHPTADQMYKELHQEIATLSKTTIYNTLKTLVEAGVVKELMIENNEMRYDIITEFHGHFKCEDCGKIHNFGIKLEDVALTGLNSFLIKQKDVYFKGVCPDCLSNKEILQEEM